MTQLSKVSEDECHLIIWSITLLFTLSLRKKSMKNVNQDKTIYIKQKG